MNNNLQCPRCPNGKHSSKDTLCKRCLMEIRNFKMPLIDEETLGEKQE